GLSPRPLGQWRPRLLLALLGRALRVRLPALLDHRRRGLCIRVPAPLAGKGVAGVSSRSRARTNAAPRPPNAAASALSLQCAELGLCAPPSRSRRRGSDDRAAGRAAPGEHGGWG